MQLHAAPTLHQPIMWQQAVLWMSLLFTSSQQQLHRSRRTGHTAVPVAHASDAHASVHMQLFTCILLHVHLLACICNRHTMCLRLL